uniref:Photolyase/cryptochrome alpha/beta domain-containing protein n=1 Tax=Macrostomum lignano TaxID=282301 RepID=A0A1I8HLC2_9PLAT
MERVGISAAILFVGHDCERALETSGLRGFAQKHDLFSKVADFRGGRLGPKRAPELRSEVAAMLQEKFRIAVPNRRELNYASASEFGHWIGWPDDVPDDCPPNRLTVAQLKCLQSSMGNIAFIPNKKAPSRKRHRPPTKNIPTAIRSPKDHDATVGQSSSAASAVGHRITVGQSSSAASAVGHRIIVGQSSYAASAVGHRITVGQSSSAVAPPPHHRWPEFIRRERRRPPHHRWPEFIRRERRRPPHHRWPEFIRRGAVGHRITVGQSSSAAS